MNNADKTDQNLHNLCTRIHHEIEPSDSWQALRARIDNRLCRPPAQYVGNILFWKRLAFSMAACFLLTAGTMIYFLGTLHEAQQYRMTDAAGVNNMLSQTDLNNLSVTFSHIRHLFGEQSQWIMVGSGDRTQMGVADTTVSSENSNKIVVVRLVVNMDNMESGQQYYDIVTFSDQRTDFQLPINDVSEIHVSLTPTLQDNGRIEVQIAAQAGTQSNTHVLSTIQNDRFTSLIRMRTNGSWISIDGTGQTISEI